MKRISLFFTFCASMLVSLAHDFEVDGIYYNITSSTDLTVAVTYQGSDKKEFANEYSGILIIPSTVTYDTKTYSVTSIAAETFWDCGSLASITIPSSVTSIDNFVFRNCISLKEVIFEDGIETLSLGNEYYNYTRSLFYYCPLEKIYLGRNLTYSSSPFSDKDELVSVTLGEGILSVGDEAFYSCDNLTSITIPEGVTSIGGFAFNNCRSLTSVVIPTSVTSINNSVFNGCNKLTSIYCFSDEVPSLGGSSVFYSVPTSCKVFVPVGMVTSFLSASYWKDFNIIEYNNLDRASHTPVDLYIAGNPTRWESSRDEGTTWMNIDCNSIKYTEENPKRGKVLYRILNEDGSYSELLTVTYYDVVPSEILTSPTSETKTVDESTTFTLDVKDDGYTYQWMHNGAAIAGATSSSYTISTVKSADAGTYYCAVSNPVSTVNSTNVELTVNKCAQVITFPELEAKTYGDADFALPATTDKGLAISYQSSNSSVATVTGNTVTITGVGETNLIATQAGSADYLEAAYVTRKLTVNKITQTISFEALSEKTYEDIPFTLPSTTDKGLTISYQSINTDVATIDGHTVTIVGAGTTEIVASQEGDGYHYAATPVTRTLTVNKKAQAITFAAFETKTYGDAPIELNQYTDKNLEITYTSDNVEVASVTGNKVNILRPGVATITATQAGTKNYLPAETKQRTLTVVKAPQTIEWYGMDAKFYGDADFTLPAATDKGLTITYVSDNESVAAVEGNTISIKGAGQANITATQAGNDYYNAAASVTQTLVVSKSYQTIVFDELPVLTYGAAPMKLTATTNASTVVTYESSDESVATVSGNTLTIVGAGICYITAKADGDNNFYGGTPVQRELTVKKAAQTINFASVPDKTYGDAPFALSAVSNRNLPITFTSSAASIVSVSENTCTINGAGTVTLTATQEGTRNYEGATAQIEVIVNKASLIAEAVDAERLYGDNNPKLKINYIGLKNGDTAEDLLEMPLAVCSATEKSNVGEYDITIAPITDKNYTLTYRKGTLTVKKAPLTITAINAAKIYGEKNPTLTVRYDGFRNGQDESELLNKPVVSTKAKVMSNVGEYPIVVEGAEARNYEIGYQEGVLTISKATLTILLDDVQREYGTNSEYSFSYKGFKGDDNVNDLDAMPTVVTEADIRSDVGVYEMTLQGGYDNNYLYTFVYAMSSTHGTIKITKAPLLITADNKTMEYLSEMPRLTMSYSGFRNNDTQDDLDQWPRISCEAYSTSVVGMYEIRLSGGYDNNYEYTLKNGTLTIVEPSQIEEVKNSDSWPVDIYDMNGRLIRKDAYSLQGLEKGLYIVNGKKLLIND